MTMKMPAEMCNDADLRRAAAALQHATRHDTEGLQAVFAEAEECGRLPHFMTAQAVFAVSLFPALASDYGRGCINSYIEAVVSSDE